MFEFDDVDILSSLCQAEVWTRKVDGEAEIDFGYCLIVNNTEVVLTESELQYMMDEIAKVKGEVNYE